MIDFFKYFGVIIIISGAVLAIFEIIKLWYSRKESDKNSRVVFYVSIALILGGLCSRMVESYLANRGSAEVSKKIDTLTEFVKDSIPRNSIARLNDSIGHSIKPVIDERNDSVANSKIGVSNLTKESILGTKIADSCMQTLTISTTRNEYWEIYNNEKVICSFVPIEDGEADKNGLTAQYALHDRIPYRYADVRLPCGEYYLKIINNMGYTKMSSYSEGRMHVTIAPDRRAILDLDDLGEMLIRVGRHNKTSN